MSQTYRGLHRQLNGLSTQVVFKTGLLYSDTHSAYTLRADTMCQIIEVVVLHVCFYVYVRTYICDTMYVH
jgi:uncharacterized membrane protein YesL